MTEAPARVEPFGDAAVLVTLGAGMDPLVSRRARAIAEAVTARRERERWLGRPVPAYASVLVPFDPLAIEPTAAMAIVAEIAAEARPPEADEGAGPVIEIRVRYGGPDGPDLDAVAELAGLRPADVVELHTGTTYEAFFVGFAPGFAYLGRVPAAIAVPRLATPRERVPAGSVGIAGEQTGVYPFDLPGGWRIVGRTRTAMWDLDRPRPALVGPADRVRFVPIP